MKILIPMDISEVSCNALKYAMDRFPAASCTILHVITGILDFRLPNQVRTGVTQDVLHRQEMEQTVLDYLGLSEMPANVHIEVYYGEPVNVIVKYQNDHAFDAVVVGSRDKYDLVDKIFGTISLGIVKRSKVPIFAVPRYAGYKRYQKIMVASDEHIADPDIILALNYWNTTNAQVSFVHVTDHEKDDFTATKEELLKRLYEEYQPPFTYEIKQVKGRDVAESLLANAYNYGADILIVIARRASFLHSLIFKSVSKDLILKSAIPVLFLHPQNTNH